MAVLFGWFGRNVEKHITVPHTDTFIIYKSADGLLNIFAQEDSDASVVTGNGLLLGKLFNNEHSRPVHKFDKLITPSECLNNYWGRYAGILYDEATSTASLIRDPLGLSTLFSISVPEGIIFSTKLSSLYDMLHSKPGINWLFFGEYILEYHFATAQTPFQHITELMPGMILTVTPGGTLSEQFGWNIPHPEKNTDEHAIEDIIFNSIKSSTEAWTSGIKDFTIELSGGVDSSSVLCMLKHCAPEASISAVHYNDSQIISSQEIRYAEQIAQECDTQLNVIDYQNLKLIDELPSDWRPSKPVTFLTFPGMSKGVQAFAGTSMIMSGQGGDHVFLAPPPKQSIADYWLDNGLSGINTISHELSSSYRTSWWQLMGTTVKSLKNYYLGRMETMHEDFVSPLDPQLTTQLSNSPFYIDGLLKNYHPGKAAQIKALWHAVTYADRDQRFDDRIVTHPLLSLPIVDAALKIPTYKTIKNGYNRYFLRKAISRISPSTVIWRRNKGHITASMLKALNRELNSVSNLINHGSLIKQGILDKEWLNTKLTQIRHGNGRNLMPLLRIISAELWLKQWKL